MTRLALGRIGVSVTLFLVVLTIQIQLNFWWCWVGTYCPYFIQTKALDHCTMLIWQVFYIRLPASLLFNYTTNLNAWGFTQRKKNQSLSLLLFQQVMFTSVPGFHFSLCFMTTLFLSYALLFFFYCFMGKRYLLWILITQQEQGNSQIKPSI